MDISIISNSAVPLYEQLMNEIRNLILKGELNQGELLPSIRMLAKELKISIITVKRAYEELEKEGFIITVAGKGTYVSDSNTERLKEIQIRKIEDTLEEVVVAARAIDLSLKELQERLEIIFREVE